MTPVALARWGAWLRLGLVALAVALEKLSDRPVGAGDHFATVVVLAGAYAGISLAMSVEWPTRPPWGWRASAPVDLIFVSALVYESGGAYSELRYVFAAVPLVAVIAGRPRDTITAVVASVVAFALVVLAHPATSSAAERREIFSESLLVLWIGALVWLLSVVVAERGERAVARQRRLAAQAIEVEESAQRRLARRLHDDPVQDLVAAEMELGRAAKGDTDSLVRARLAIKRAMPKLRSAIFDLYPPTLDQLGLALAVRTEAEQRAADARVALTTSIDDSTSGVHDQLVMSVARELLANSAQHSGATELNVELAIRRGRVVLLVEDNGVGLTASRLEAARADGHIGLLTCRERALAFGGTLDIHSTPSRGTRVTVTLPVRREGDLGPIGGYVEPQRRNERALVPLETHLGTGRHGTRPFRPSPLFDVADSPDSP